MIDYEDLTPDLVLGICRLFRLNIADDQRRLFSEVFCVDAKDRSVPFCDDAQRKQRAVTPSIRESTDRWISDSYRELRKRSRSFTTNLLKHLRGDTLELASDET